MKKLEDVSLLRNQVRTFISNLNTKHAYLNAENNTDFASAILDKAVRIYGKQEIKENVSEFYTDPLGNPSYTSGESDCIVRTAQLLDSMKTLLSFLDYHTGDPVAMELFSDTLSQAKEVLRQDMTICSILLSRITLEQSLRRLCDLKNIKYEPNEKTSSLKDKLRKPEGVLELHESKELDAKLTLLNKAIHKEIEVTRKDAEEMIEWTGKFIARFLEGHDA